jgi:hypothetical protein
MTLYELIDIAGGWSNAAGRPADLPGERDKDFEILITDGGGREYRIDDIELIKRRIVFRSSNDYREQILAEYRHDQGDEGLFASGDVIPASGMEQGTPCDKSRCVECNARQQALERNGRCEDDPTYCILLEPQPSTGGATPGPWTTMMNNSTVPMFTQDEEHVRELLRSRYKRFGFQHEMKLCIVVPHTAELEVDFPKQYVRSGPSSVTGNGGIDPIPSDPIPVDRVPGVSDMRYG